MSQFSLSDLLKSLMSSIAQANAHLHGLHLTSIEDHFSYDKKNKHWEPNTLAMKLPRSVIKEGDEVEQPVDVPTYALVSHDPIGMGELDLDISCNVEDVLEDANGIKQMMVNLDGGNNNSASKSINITFKIRSLDVPEGMSRINDALVRKI